MSFTRRIPAGLLVVGAVAVMPPAAAEPDARGQSAATVIDQFQQQGYAVQVNGSPAGDPALLSTCTVTSVRKSGATPSDSTAKTVFVDVACPLVHG